MNTAGSVVVREAAVDREMGRVRGGLLLILATAFLFCLVAPSSAQTFTLTNTSAHGSLVGAYPDFTIIGSNDLSGTAGSTSYGATFATAATVTFTWTYTPNDSHGTGFDRPGYSLNGTFTQLVDDSNLLVQSGSTSVAVAAGQTFAWVQQTRDNGGGNATLEVHVSVHPSAQSQAIDFVTERQQILLSSIDLPSIFDRAETGVQVQQDAGGRVNALAFSASTARLTPAEDALTRATTDETAAAGSDGVDFWIDGRLGLHTSGSDVGKFAVTTLGIDKTFDGRVLLGLAVEGDWVTAPSGPTDGISGLGFMAGPYASVALTDTLAISAHVLAGRSWNDQTSTQGGTTYTGSFITNRLDVGTSLSGDFTQDVLTVRPNISVSLITESAGDYMLSGGGGTLAVPGFNVTTLEASAGSAFEYRLDAGNGVVFVPKGSIDLGLDRLSTSSLFAQAMLGLGVQTEDGLNLDLGVQSRAGTDGLRTLAVTATLGGSL